MEKLTLSVSEAANLLGLCPESVYRLCKKDDFPAFKANGRTLISVKGLENWVQEQARQGCSG